MVSLSNRFGGFRAPSPELWRVDDRRHNRDHGCPAFVAKLLRRSRLKPWGSIPIEFSMTERKQAVLCQCKQAKTPPFCDGTHNTL